MLHMRPFRMNEEDADTRSIRTILRKGEIGLKVSNTPIPLAIINHQNNNSNNNNSKEDELLPIPESLNSLSSLIKLELNYTDIAGHLPNCISILSSLQTLRLDGSGVTELPVTLFSLPLLSELSLSYNKLILPPQLSLLQNSLTSLNLDRCSLVSLPLSLYSLCRYVYVCMYVCLYVLMYVYVW